MSHNSRKWLEKATFDTSVLGPPPAGGLLSPEQMKEFFRVALDSTVILNDADVIFHSSPSFEIPRINFNGRVLRPGGAECSRLTEPDRYSPTTGLATLNTVRVRGEIPVSDEVFEDNIEKDKLADTIMEQASEAFGRDVEELLIKGDTDRTGGEDQYLDLLDGIIAQLQDDLPAAQIIDMSAVGASTDFIGMFSDAKKALPARYKKNSNALRFYVPTSKRDCYQTSLSNRGTGLGDTAVLAQMMTNLAFQGIQVVEVPIMTGTDLINTVAIDYDEFGILIDPQNIAVGFQRAMKLETWRDPREGCWSLVLTGRVDVRLKDPSAAVLITNIPTDLN